MQVGEFMIQIEVTRNTIKKCEEAIKKYNESDEGIAIISSYHDILNIVLDKYLGIPKEPGIPVEQFGNKITDKVDDKLGSNINWKADVIRDLTYFLNDNYNDSCTIEKLHKDFEFLLEQRNAVRYLQPYIEYFIQSGMLEKGDGVFIIHKTKKLPKRKKLPPKDEVGILQELGMLGDEKK